MYSKLTYLTYLNISQLYLYVLPYHIMINYDYIQHIKYIDYNCIKGFQYEKYVVKKLHDYFNIDIILLLIY